MKKAVTGGAKDAVASLAYPAKRKNIPPAGLEAHGVVHKAATVQYAFNPHLPPVLRSSSEPANTDRLPELLAAARQRALTADEAEVLADALRRHEPWLEWSGKRERPWFKVEPVALHMHERVSTQAILRVLARRDVQRNLFADPQHDYAKAVQFYRHDVDWSNRMILGDSLQVMASLARREDLAGKVQMIYVDPPYGIKFSSNFQPRLGQRDVKDRQQDLTREPEMVKAYRDTWTLGIHSYLAYLRDRLTMARELLADTGSVFVQISDENLHRVRCVMDEVFGSNNFISVISIRKTTSQGTAGLLGATTDFVVWYARARDATKYRQVFVARSGAADDRYDQAMLPDGAVASSSTLTHSPIGSGRLFRLDNLTSSRPAGDGDVRTFEYQNDSYTPGRGTFKTNMDGLTRLANAERLLITSGALLQYLRFKDDFPISAIGNLWHDISGAVQSRTDPKVYVVQSSTELVARCLLMTTDPGDLVLDPTCGSGTTAHVAEQWGRRWITIDTSRVALALAKHRLLTAKFDYYQLRDLTAEDIARNPDGTWIAEVDGHGAPTGKRLTFDCKTVPHITLRSIARNTSLDPIFAKHEPVLNGALAALNRAAATVDAGVKEELARKLIKKHREAGSNAVTDADVRRWLLPSADLAWIAAVPARKPLKGVTLKQAAKYREQVPRDGWKHWQAPFDADSDWPQMLQEALTAYRAAWRAKMDEVSTCIAANAETEELVDKPAVVGGMVRVAGPFTMEGVIAREEGPDSPIGGTPDELRPFDPEDDAETAIADAEAHLDKVIRLLKASGVDFPDNKNVKFSRLDPTTGAGLIHAEGELQNGGGGDRGVAVSIGPEVGNLTVMQVEDALRHANRTGYDDVVFAGFGFDASAQEVIEDQSHPRLRLHMALISPDVAMGDLLKNQPGSQLFRVFSAPRVTGLTRQDGGDCVVEVEGMDVYDPVSNALYPSDKTRIAAWFLDTDYDGRTFCICQAFFPDKTKWDKLARALGNVGAVDPAAFDALSGFRSLPFPRPARLGKGETWKVAVKVIDPRGNEGLRVLTEGSR